MSSVSRPTASWKRFGALLAVSAVALATVPTLAAIAAEVHDGQRAEGRQQPGEVRREPDAGRPVVGAGSPVEPAPAPRGAPQPPTPALAERFAEEPTEVMTGWASWYGPGFAGRRTASGEIYDPAEMVAAHRSLPFGTRIRVTNQRNGAGVVVRITDRGPYVGGRILDLSAAAADAIGMRSSGTAPVAIEVL